MNKKMDPLWYHNVAFTILALYWMTMTFLVVPFACVAHYVLLLYPIRVVLSHDLFMRLENKLCRMVNDHWSAGATVSANMEIVEYGDDIGALTDKRCLLIANHLGLADHFALMLALHNKGSVAEKYLWLIYNIWRWTPMGVMWMLHGNFFVYGGVKQREQGLVEFREHLSACYWRYDYRWIVMYPEGSRFFLVRDSSRKFARSNGYPELDHCALPRTGAAKAIFDVCGPKSKTGSHSGRNGYIRNHVLEQPSAASGDAHALSAVAQHHPQQPIEYVIDATLGYHRGKVTDVWSAMVRKWVMGVNRVAIHYQVHKVTSAIANSEEDLRRWLFDRWVEKDKKLDYFYKCDRFEEKPTNSHKNGVAVPFSRWKTVMTQVFWLASAYFHLRMWLYPVISTGYYYSITG